MSVPFITAWMRMISTSIVASRALIHPSNWVTPDQDNTSASRNGGRKSSVAQAKRAARKDRNRAAHRMACR